LKGRPNASLNRACWTREKVAMKDISEVKKDQAIQGILDAAKEVFAEVGFAGARVDEIARRAVVNKAMIYYRVGNKATLYSEVLHQAFSGIVERLFRNLEAAHTPEEKLKAYIRTFVQTFEQNPHLPPIMMREMASGGHHMPEIVITDLGRILTILMGILDEGVRQGVFVEAKPSILHLMIISPIFMRSRMELIASRRKEHARLLRQFDMEQPIVVGREIERFVMRAIKSD
jgi:AcrR family transcriptional regulator